MPPRNCAALALIVVLAAGCAAPPPYGTRNLRTELDITVLPSAAVEPGRMPSGSTASVTVYGAEYAPGRLRFRVPMTRPTVRVGPSSGTITPTGGPMAPPGNERFRATFTAPVVDTDKVVRIEATDGNTLGRTEITIHPAGSTVAMSTRAGDTISVDVVSVYRNPQGWLCHHYRLRQGANGGGVTLAQLDFRVPMHVSYSGASLTRRSAPIPSPVTISGGLLGTSFAITSLTGLRPRQGGVNIRACGDARAGGQATWNFQQTSPAWVRTTTVGPR